MRAANSVNLAILCAWLSLAGAVAGVRTGIAPTPPMGFNSWYMHGPAVDEGVIKGMVAYLTTNGLSELGYRYVVLDEGWTYPYGDPNGRDAAGNIVPNPSRFPGGIKALADYAHSEGLKFGIYTEDTTRTASGYIGSAGHFAQDAATYASWGVDFVKFDVYARADYRTPITQFAEAIDATGRPMFLYVGLSQVADPWVLDHANALRFTGDMNGSYGVLLYHIFFGASIPEAVRPDRWVDLDVLVWTAGLVGGVSVDTLKTSMGMYAMLSAPMFIPGWLDPGLYPEAFKILSNPEVIAVNQDVAGVQGRCVRTNGTSYVWSKPLAPTNGLVKAVALMNTDMTTSQSITVTWSDLGLPAGTFADVRNLWTQESVTAAGAGFTRVVPARSLELVRIVPRPAVTVRNTGGGLVCSWPAGFPDFVLESSPSMEAPRWQPVAGIPVATDGRLVMGLGPAGGAMFLRLRQQGASEVESRRTTDGADGTDEMRPGAAGTTSLPNRS